MSIVPLNIGSASNDGNGQNLRSGGQVINANFAELDQRTTAAQSAADAAQAKADTAQAKADAAIPSLQKGQPNGVAGLDGSGTVPASQLPSYVDDVLEFGSFAALPAAGETGKIYITTDTNSQYRWSGTQYVLLTASPGSTDSVPEGAINKYWTLARTLGSVLTGLVTTNPAVVAATDTVIVAFGKLQRQITDLVSSKANNGDNNDITSLRALSADGFDRIRQGIAPMVGATASSVGTKGLVPVASVAERLKVLSGAGTWVALPTGAAWGAITGTLSAQTDLVAELNKYQLKSSIIAANQIIAGGTFTCVAPPVLTNANNITSITRTAAGDFIITLPNSLKSGWKCFCTAAGVSGSTWYNALQVNPMQAGTAGNTIPLKGLQSTGSATLLDSPGGVAQFIIIGEWA